MLHRLALFSIIALLLIGAVCAKRLEAASVGLLSLNFDVLIITDFINDWTAAHLVQAGNVAAIFDPKAYSDFMVELWGKPLEWHTWSYPPHLLLFIPPFAHFSYGVGLLLWSLLGLLGYRFALKQAVPDMPISWQAALLFSPAAMVCLLHGQTGLFCAAFLLGGLYLLPRHPQYAGILFGLLTLKPHIGVLLVPLLLMRREWRAILSASITAATLIGLSVLSWGIEPWISYLTTTRALHVKLLENLNGFYYYMMPGVLPSLRLLGVSTAIAWSVFAVVAAVATFLSLRWIHREGLTPRTIFGFTLAAMLAMPYGFNYDMTSISLALGIYLFSEIRHRLDTGLVYFLVWVSPALVYYLNALGAPLIPLILIGPLLLLKQEGPAPRT